MNIQTEAQAVNRVHRIGQNRQTYVHKYIVSGSVEKKIYDFSVRALESVRESFVHTGVLTRGDVSTSSNSENSSGTQSNENLVTENETFVTENVSKDILVAATAVRRSSKMNDQETLTVEDYKYLLGV